MKYEKAALGQVMSPQIHTHIVHVNINGPIAIMTHLTDEALEAEGYDLSFTVGTTSNPEVVQKFPALEVALAWSEALTDALKARLEMRGL